MKAILLSVLIYLINFTPISSQVTVDWSDPIPVVAQGNRSPVIGLLSDGTPVAMWGSSGTIYYSRLENGAFTSATEISTGNVSPDIYTFGGLDMAIHQNTVFIVFENFTNGVYLIRSQDGGDNFDAPVNVYDPPPGKWATLASVSTDDQGNPIVSVIFENTNETEGQYILMTSPDGGESFSDPVIASEPADGEYVCECCPSAIHSQGNDIWLVFRNNDNNLRDMWVSKSSDNGNTFDTAVDIDESDWLIFTCPISGPKIAPMAGDSLITVWRTGAFGGSDVFISTLHGGTMEKGFERAVPHTNDNSTQTNINVAGQNDTLGIIWEESGFGINSVDLLFSFSTNGSQGLLQQIINVTDAPGSQRRPSIAYRNGIFHLLCTDGGSGLQYRSGNLTEISASPSQTLEDAGLRILEQPIRNQLIKMEYKGKNSIQNIEMELLDESGKKHKHWYMVLLNSNENIQLDIPDLSIGMYFLHLRSDTIQGSLKLFITN